MIDHRETRFEEELNSVDLVFDTVGGELLRRSAGTVRNGGRLVSIAEEPPEVSSDANIEAMYFVVQPDQLVELARLADRSVLKPAIESIFPLYEARAAFERSMETSTRGKLILRVADD